MKCFMLVLVFVAATLARPSPDVSHLSGGYHYQQSSSSSNSEGYNYKPPSTSYGVPIRPDGSHQHHYHQEVPTGSYLPASPVNQGLPRPDSHGDFNGHYQSESNYNYHQQGLYNPSLIQDQKHVFYFASPDEHEEQQRLRINIVPSNQKNTNVIFVKAPTYGNPIPEVHAPPSTIEDKTKVVVLVKKPEKQAPINIPAPPVTKHGKPEVFVVKYKDQHEAERAVAGGSGGHPLGTNVHQVRDEHTFVKTLEADKLPYGSFSGLGSRSGFENSGESHSYESGSSLKGAVSDDKDSFGGSSVSSGNSFGGSDSSKDSHSGSSFSSSFESSSAGSSKDSFGGSGVDKGDSHSSGSFGSTFEISGSSGKDSFGSSGSGKDGASSGSSYSSSYETSGISGKDAFGGSDAVKGGHSSSSYSSSYETSGVSGDSDTAAKDGSHSSGSFSYEVNGVSGKVGGSDSVTGSSHSSGSVSSYEVSSGSSSGDFGSSSLSSRLGEGVQKKSSGSLRITVETDGVNFSGSASDSSVSGVAQKTLEGDSLFNKYGPPKESGPY